MAEQRELDGGEFMLGYSNYERAKVAGARILSELQDNPGIGQRQYRAEDIEGHRWMFAEPL
jgi:PhnB protein